MRPKKDKAAPEKAAPAKKASPAPRNKTKAEAEAEAAEVGGDINRLKELIVKEMCLVTKGERVDIQLALAYCRQLLAKKQD